MLNASKRAFFLASSLLLALAGCASKAERANDAYTKAQQLASSGRMDDAKRELMRAVSIRDDVPDIWMALGQLRLASGELPEAFAAFGRADELRPGDADTLRQVAYTGYMIGAAQLAKDATDRLLNLAPADTQGLTVSGLLALDKGEPAATLEAAEKILTAAPGDPTGLLLKARAMAVQGHLGDAIVLLKEAKVSPQAQPGVNFALLQFYRASGDVAGMLAVFPDLVAAQKTNADLALDYANLLYRTGNIKEARKVWTDAILTRRDDGKFVAWAFDLYDNSEPDNAPPYLDERLMRQDGSPLRSAAGQYLITRGDFARAAALISAGRGAAVNDRGLYAVALDGIGKRAQAEALVNTVLAETGGTQDPNALMLRARWAIAKRQFDRAAADAQAAVIADPSNIAARLVLAQSYMSNQQPLRVRQVLAEAVSDLPRSHRALSAYLRFLQSAGDHEASIAAARNFADANGAQPWGWSVLGSACQKINDGACMISAKKRYDLAMRDFTFTNPARPFKVRGLFSPLPTPG